MMHKNQFCYIIAWPNGAGKTTFAQEFLPKEAECPLFVNADLIAAGLSPFTPGRADIRAGRLMLEEIASHVARRENFAFETTLRGKKMKTAKEIVLKKDVAKVSAALRRAAKQARKKAVQTCTPLVIYEDGRVKRKRVVEG